MLPWKINTYYRIYSRSSRTFLTKILYLNLGCVIYARKWFYVNKSGYTGNFLKYFIKSVNYAMAWITVYGIYSECTFVALVIQHANSTRCVILSSVARLALAYVSSLPHTFPHYLIRFRTTSYVSSLPHTFPHYLVHGRTFWRRKKKDIQHKMCVLIFSTAFVYDISHSKKNTVRYRHQCT